MTEADKLRAEVLEMLQDESRLRIMPAYWAEVIKDAQIQLNRIDMELGEKRRAREAKEAQLEKARQADDRP